MLRGVDVTEGSASVPKFVMDEAYFGLPSPLCFRKRVGGGTMNEGAVPVKALAHSR
jgi:hypothetical protein